MILPTWYSQCHLFKPSLADPLAKPVTKRRIALLKTMGKPTEAIHALTKFLDVSPTDAEAWAELSDLYVSQGLYSQAIFALEEVLLITPNAWNVGVLPMAILDVAHSGANLVVTDPC